MSDFVQPLAQSNYELVPLPGAFITDGRFVRYENDKNISDTVKDFDGKIESATEAAEEASDKADALDVRVTALENKPSGDDYSPLKNKPKINGVELSGNKTAEDLGLGTYSKPSGGIPKTDLAEAVRNSLSKADTALQTEQYTGTYSKPSGGIPKSDLANDVQTSLGKADTALQEHQDISGKIDAPQVATVGQVLAVKAVDASGKPTEWETVEKGGGGGKHRIWIKDIYTSASTAQSCPVVWDGEIHVFVGRTHYIFRNGDFITATSPGVEVCAAVVYHDAIHVFSGGYSSTYSQHRAYSKTNGWVTVNSGNFAYENRNSAVVINDRIHLLGSVYSDKTANFKNLYWEEGKSYWSLGSTLPYSFRYGAAVVVDNKIHLLGGADNKTAHYISSGGWSTSTRLPYNFSYASAVEFDGELHILGSCGNGTSSEPDMTSFMHYKFSNGVWEKVSTLPYPFTYGSAVVFNDDIYIFGSSATTSPILKSTYSSYPKITESNNYYYARYTAI